MLVSQRANHNKIITKSHQPTRPRCSTMAGGWPSGRSCLLLVGKKSAVQHEDRREEPFAHLAMEEYLWLSHDEIHEIPWKITHEIPKKCQVMIYFDG